MNIEEVIEEVEHVTYLGSVIDTQSGTEADVTPRIGKARYPFFNWRTFGNPMSFPWKTRSGFSIPTNAEAVFFTEQRHGWPQWLPQRRYRPLSTESLVSGGLKPPVMNGCGNQHIYVRCRSNRRSDRNAGHTHDNIARQTLTWNSERKRKRGKPRNTWRRDLETDVKESGISARQLVRLAQVRNAWRNHAAGRLCPRMGDESLD